MKDYKRTVLEFFCVWVLLCGVFRDGRGRGEAGEAGGGGGREGKCFDLHTSRWVVIGWVFLVIAAPVFVSSIPPYPRTGLGLLLLLSFGVGETFLLYLSFLLVSFS